MAASNLIEVNVRKVKNTTFINDRSLSALCSDGSWLDHHCPGYWRGLLTRKGEHRYHSAVRASSQSHSLEEAKVSD